MKKKIAALLFLSLGALSSPSALATAERGSEAEAREMVGKAIALIKKSGSEKAYQILNQNLDPSFKDRDLFVFVYDFQGTMLVSGINQRMVGKNLIDMKDGDGIPLAKGMIDMVKEKKKGWYGPYKFANPATNGYEYKKSYCEQASENTLVCVGVYSGIVK